MRAALGRNISSELGAQSSGVQSWGPHLASKSEAPALGRLYWRSGSQGMASRVVTGADGFWGVACGVRGRRPPHVAACGAERVPLSDSPPLRRAVAQAGGVGLPFLASPHMGWTRNGSKSRSPQKWASHVRSSADVAVLSSADEGRTQLAAWAMHAARTATEMLPRARLYRRR